MYMYTHTSYSALSANGGSDLVGCVSQGEGEVSDVRQLLFPVGLKVFPQLLHMSLNHTHLEEEDGATFWWSGILHSRKALRWIDPVEWNIASLYNIIVQLGKP